VWVVLALGPVLLGVASTTRTHAESII
jgi:hypothetical protein